MLGALAFLIGAVVSFTCSLLNHHFYKEHMEVEWIQTTALRVAVKYWLLLISPVSLTLFALDDAFNASWLLAYKGWGIAKRFGTATSHSVFPS